MKTVLLINLHQKYEGFAKGKLNQLIIDEAKEFFEANGYKTQQSVAESNYSVEEELEKFKTADIFFVQSPVYWMGLPWIGKKYIDEIFSGGSGTVTFNNDGRSNGGKYGSGGLMQDKHYMLSFTYNCPTSEFDNTEGFFEGLSVDKANISLHKAFQFCGAKPLKSFSVHDVYGENFNLDSWLDNLRSVLKQNFHKE
jgi:modulator of drug activity B